MASSENHIHTIRQKLLSGKFAIVNVDTYTGDVPMIMKIKIRDHRIYYLESESDHSKTHTEITEIKDLGNDHFILNDYQVQFKALSMSEKLAYQRNKATFNSPGLG